MKYFKINLQKLADICGYELPTNLQNFTQKDLTKVKIFQKVLRDNVTFSETPCRWCAATALDHSANTQKTVEGIVKILI